MATSAANGPSADLNGSAAKAPNTSPPSQSGRASMAATVPEPSRKENEDASQRRPPPPKAWTQGLNPITQRSNTPSNPSYTNGTMPKPQARNSSHPEARSSDRGLLDRQSSYMLASVGLECKINTRAGETFSGIFAGSQKQAEDFKLAFKMVKIISAESAGDLVNGDNREVASEYKGAGSDHTMVFSVSTLTSVDLPEVAVAPQVATANGLPAGFRTDTDISRATSGGEHRFQKWVAPSALDGLDMSLGSAGDWDQFKANEQKFGVKSDYDENLYTTTIDRNNPLYAMREREAARIAREIETDTSGNAHMREERGHKDDGADEEEKYSGVRRGGPEYPPLQTSQPNRYMPPGRRTQAPGSGAMDSPIDPAIISSQIARAEPGDASKKTERKVVPVGSAIDPKVESKPEQKASVHGKEAKPLRQTGKPGATATENVETEVLDSFRQFAANEKIKVQDHKRSRASAEKSVKLNDLKKFSQNFKLLTPVPNDLIPILARDEERQNEIVQKALKNCDDSKTAKGVSVDPKTQRPLAAARLDRETPTAGGNMSRSRHDGGAHAHPSKDRHPQLPQTRPAPIGLSARLADSHKLHKAGMMAAVPQPLPIQENRNASGRSSNFQSALPSPQKAASIRGPPSATSSKFNVKASEFKPNPAASAFKPAAGPAASTAASSPRSGSITRTMSPAAAQPKFFGDRKAFGKSSERLDPIKLVTPKKPAVSKDTVESKDASKDGRKGSVAGAAPKGGFQPPYKTHPTWHPPPTQDGEHVAPETKYWEVFDRLRYGRHASPRGKISPVNPAAHQHQLPLHLQNGPAPVPQLHTPQPAPQQMHPQPHHFHHGPPFDEHHARQPMPNGHMYPGASPRMQHNSMAFHSPMPQHAQLYGQPVQYVMHAQPPMNGRQFSSGGGPQMMPMPAGTHLAPMMVQQPSSGGGAGGQGGHGGQGGYMPQPMAVPYNPQQQGMPAMYAGPAPAMYPSPSQGPPSGYPSPGRGAPMMMHQGSHQGHPAGQAVYVPTNQFGQPFYPQQPPAHMSNVRAGYGSPQPHFPQAGFPQQHPFPHQAPHRTPSAGYVQPHQAPSHPPAHHPTPQGAPAELGSDEAK